MSKEWESSGTVLNLETLQKAKEILQKNDDWGMECHDFTCYKCKEKTSHPNSSLHLLFMNTPKGVFLHCERCRFTPGYPPEEKK